MAITKVNASTIIDASIYDLWKTVRNFNNITLWHPDVKDSVIENEMRGDQVGAIRAIHLQNGLFIREKLIELSDVKFTYTYSVIEAPFSISNHYSKVMFMPVTTNNHTFVTWEAEFVVPENEAEGMAQGVLQGVILLGFEGLKNLVR